MKNTLILMLFFITFSNSTQSQNTTKSEDILGIWLSENKDGKIEIFKSNGKFYGKLIWGKKMYEVDGKTSVKDINNENQKLRSRNLKDLIILSDFVFKNDSWTDGKIYDPDSGKTYSCNLKLKNNKLEIRGYVGLSIFGRTSIWIKEK